MLTLTLTCAMKCFSLAFSLVLFSLCPKTVSVLLVFFDSWIIWIFMPVLWDFFLAINVSVRKSICMSLYLCLCDGAKIAVQRTNFQLTVSFCMKNGRGKISTNLHKRTHTHTPTTIQQSTAKRNAFLWRKIRGKSNAKYTHTLSSTHTNTTATKEARLDA